MKYGFVKVGCSSPKLKIADCDFNSDEIIKEAYALASGGVEIAVFPELCITGYSCKDLFLQDSLQKASIKALGKILDKCKNLEMLMFVGLPIRYKNRLYDVVAAIFKGSIMALYPRCCFSDSTMKKVFTPYPLREDRSFYFEMLNQDHIVLSPDTIVEIRTNEYTFKIGCDVGEDSFSPISPSTIAVLRGVNLVVNPFAAIEKIGEDEKLISHIKGISSRLLCGYVSCGVSVYESTQDSVYKGQKFIAENGKILSMHQDYNTTHIINDLDIQAIDNQRFNKDGFNESLYMHNDVRGFSAILEHDFNTKTKLTRKIPSNPFLSSENDYKDIINMQAMGLARRLESINTFSAVVGLSGGLDSTLALLVTCKAFDICNKSKKKITAITMPCFGTTDRTYNNACLLAKECGVTLKEIPIKESVIKHFSDIGQDENKKDVTYENSQARERTQVLMDYANKVNGIVIGTGDLSELALGWCTYNGDHMSMYAVNSGVTKTMVRGIVNYIANENNSSVLKDILDTPVSPELLPPAEGNISQVTEDLVGPYELHDFYLYYVLKYGFTPSKILYLAQNSSLKDTYDKNTMIKWLKIFYRRFFTQQFKRSCMPDGIQVSDISLSPRGSWNMPSDSSFALWLKEVESL